MRHSRSESGVPARLLMLGASMLARSVVNAVFAVWLANTSPSWDDIFRMGSVYALVDGTIGLAGALVIDATARSDAVRILGAITLVEATARIIGGIALRLLPGIAGFPVALLAFFAVVGAGAATLGVGALAVWLYTRARSGHVWPTHADALSDPLALTALLSFAICYALILKPPTTAGALRNLVVGGCTSLSLVFLVAFIGAITHLTGNWILRTSASANVARKP